MKILALSDTHGTHSDLTFDIYEILKEDPSIQTIVHAGDGGTYKDPIRNVDSLNSCLEWLSTFPVKNKIYVPGNHDTSLEAGLISPKNYKEITFLLHDSIRLEGRRIFGSPYTPEFHDWAYNVPRDKIGRYWEIVPNDVDILITHGPPMGVLDVSRGGSYGDLALYNEVISRIKPKVHIFGHFHDEPGHINNGIRILNNCSTKFINASIVNLSHSPVNSPIVVEV